MTRKQVEVFNSELEKTGGQAFPGDGRDGITVRDYFAGQALMGFMATLATLATSWDTGADICFSMADAMIKAREK